MSTPKALPIGQTLYAVQDTTLICVPSGGSTARYHRVSFTGSAKEPKATIDEAIDVGPLDDIRSARAVTHWDGSQEVVLLRTTGLWAITMEGGAARTTEVKADVTDARLVIGVDPVFHPGPLDANTSDPVEAKRRLLILLVESAGGFAMRELDMVSGRFGRSQPLPPTVKGRAVAAELVRCGASTMLMVTTVEEGGTAGQGRLKLHVAACDPASPVDRLPVTTLDLGSTLTSPTAQLGVAVASMRKGSPDQQLGLAWSDPAGGIRIAVVGRDEVGTWVATATPDVAFAAPEAAICRLAAADLAHEGADRLVLGYPATYGSVKGCAALMMFALDDGGIAAASEHAGASIASVSSALTGAIAGRELTVTTVPSRPLVPGALVAVGSAAPTRIVRQLSGMPGQIGTYEVEASLSVAPNTPMTATYGVLTIKAGSTGGMFPVGQAIYGEGIAAETRIVAPATATGSAAAYCVTPAQDVAATTVATTPVLACKSQYAASNAHGQPWANYDLHLGAGLFGAVVPDQAAGGSPVLGVQITGCGATMKELLDGHAFVLCGFVPVDPNSGFPPMTSDAPGLPFICAGPNGAAIAKVSAQEAGARILAFPSDLTGQSVILGPPMLTIVEECRQVLAVIQAPPYDRTLSWEPPRVDFSKSIDQNSGYTVSTGSAYNLSKGFGTNLQIGPLSIGEHVENTISRSLDRLTDDARASNMTLSSSVDLHDLVLVCGMSYAVWHYPVMKSAAKIPGNEILVVVPRNPSPTMELIPGYDYAMGYRPRSEVGMLLSYVGTDDDKDGWKGDESRRLFERDGIPVSESPGGGTLSGSAMTSSNETIGKHNVVSNAISSNAHFTASTELFDFLPLQFSLNITRSEHFTDQSADTTHVTRSEHLTWTLSSGRVNKDIYGYEIKPFIYKHDPLGFLVISWDVSLTGSNYHLDVPVDHTLRRLNDPDICLIRVAPHSTDPYLKWYSRAITFDEKSHDKQLLIEVELFNNSLVRSAEVKCEFFQDNPIVLRNDRDHALGLSEKAVKLGSLTHPGLGPCGRTKISKLVTLPDTKPCFIVVRVSSFPRAKTYWNVYPADSFSRGAGPSH
jgi:hypothetical protein